MVPSKGTGQFQRTVLLPGNLVRSRDFTFPISVIVASSAPQCWLWGDTALASLSISYLPNYKPTVTIKMPVTLKTSDTEPLPWARSEALLRGSCEEEWMRGGKIIRSFFEEAYDDSHPHISPSRHGFVYAAWDAYSNHHSLVLRPEDIWFSILVQLSF